MKENSIEELEQRLEESYRTQQARLDVGADDLNIREEIAEVDEDRALREIKRELADEDRREYMSEWFAKDLEILVYYIEKLRLENKQLQENSKIKHNQTILGDIHTIKLKDLEPYLKPLL